MGGRGREVDALKLTAKHRIKFKLGRIPSNLNFKRIGHAKWQDGGDLVTSQFLANTIFVQKTFFFTLKILLIRYEPYTENSYVPFKILDDSQNFNGFRDIHGKWLIYISRIMFLLLPRRRLDVKVSYRFYVYTSLKGARGGPRGKPFRKSTFQGKKMGDENGFQGGPRKKKKEKMGSASSRKKIYYLYMKICSERFPIKS